MDKNLSSLQREALNDPVSAKKLELMEYRLGTRKFIETVEFDGMIIDKSLIGKKCYFRIGSEWRGPTNDSLWTGEIVGFSTYGGVEVYIKYKSHFPFGSIDPKRLLHSNYRSSKYFYFGRSMKLKVLFRPSLMHEEELIIANKFFSVVKSRSQLPKDSFIVPRYSALPYFESLEQETNKLNSKLINSQAEYEYISKFQYYEDIKDFTPKTWTESEFISSFIEGKFVVKGETNSEKKNWSTKMFAQDRECALRIINDLKQNPIIKGQQIIVREFIELNILDVGKDSMPYANEWRNFYYKDQRLASGFYWTQSKTKTSHLDNAAEKLLQEVSAIVSQKTNFYVIDIAQKANGDWIVIELNSGEMSGISSCNPNELYSNLKSCLGA